MDPQDPTPGAFPPPPAPGYDVPSVPGYDVPSVPGYDVPSYGAPPDAGGMPDLAGWPQRVGAALIDGLISLAAQLVVSAVSRPLGQLVGLAVFVFFQYRQGTTGRTPGKDALKIRLLREQDGQVVGFGSAIIRGLLHIVDALPFGLGFLWPIWDAKKQTFADKIMKTVVVKG